MYIAKSYHKDTKDTIYFYEWNELDNTAIDLNFIHNIQWSTSRATLYKYADWAKAASAHYTGATNPKYDYVGDIEIVEV